MHKIDIILDAEERGGQERRQALEAIMRRAHRLGCDTHVGGGQVGGIKVRYGSIGYAVMDINCAGEVKLYVKPHPGKDAPEEISQGLNDYIEAHEGLETRSFPVHSYSNLTEQLEQVPREELLDYLERSVELIQEIYYRRPIAPFAWMYDEIRL